MSSRPTNASVAARLARDVRQLAGSRDPTPFDLADRSGRAPPGIESNLPRIRETDSGMPPDCSSQVKPKTEAPAAYAGGLQSKGREIGIDMVAEDLGSADAG